MHAHNAEFLQFLGLGLIICVSLLQIGVFSVKVMCSAGC